MKDFFQSTKFKILAAVFVVLCAFMLRADVYKRQEYVAAAVSAIRTACEGRPVDFETLRSVFSRSGFTKGYFDGRIDRETVSYTHLDVYKRQIWCVPRPDRIPLPPLRKLWQPWNLPCRLRRLEIKRKFMLFYPLPVDFFHCGVVE